MSEDKSNIVVLPSPPDLPAKFAALIGTYFKENGGAVYNNAFSTVHEFLTEQLSNQHSAREHLRVGMNSVNSSLRALYDEGEFTQAMNRLYWRVEFYDMFSNGGKTPLGVFVAFTGILDVAVDEPAELSSFIVRKVEEVTMAEELDSPLLYDDVNNCIAYCFGFMLSQGRETTAAEPVDVSRLKDAEQAPPYFDPANWISKDWLKCIVENFPVINQNKEPEVSEQQVAPVEQESDGTKPTAYYTRHGLSMLLQETSDVSDLINVEKFIDDQLATWSRHLALNTHKKQTDKTPRFSIHEGPGIITILLDRGDLDFGERAPQLQMIFSDTDTGIAITPRQQGGMTTTRMLDAFDQILLELNSGKRVPFKAVESLVTFVDHVSDHPDSLAFREAIGDPKQEMVSHGIADPDLTFYMYRKATAKKVIVEGHYSRGNGSEDCIIFEIYLDDVGHQGNLMLKIATDSPTQPPLALNVERAGELSKAEGTAEVLAPVWKEVRDTPADPDSVLEKLPVNKEALQEAIVQATALSDFYVSGRDQAMLKHVIARMSDEGNLSNHDQLALDAAANFIFGGGLINAGKWGYTAGITTNLSESEQKLLRGENNAYILIYDETGYNNQDAYAVLAFQCRVTNLQE